MNKNPINESMTPLRIQFGLGENEFLKVRVWRTESEPFSLGENQDLFDMIGDLCKEKPEFTTINDLVKFVAEKISVMDRIAAVEVLVGDTGTGIVHYPDWN